MARNLQTAAAISPDYNPTAADIPLTSRARFVSRLSRYGLAVLVVLVLAYAAYWIVLGSSYQLSAEGIRKDTGGYAEFARISLNGDLMYRDRWNNKTPGIMFFMAPFVVGFGTTLESINIAIVANNLLLGVSVGALAFAITRSSISALIAGLIGSLFAMVNQKPETTVLMASLGAFAAALAVAGKGRPLWMFFAGVLFSAGILTKQPLIFEGPILVLLAYKSAAARPWRAVAAVIAGGAVTGVLFLAWLLTNGILDDFWKQVIDANGQFISGDGWHFSPEGIQLFRVLFLGGTLPIFGSLLIAAGLSALVLFLYRKSVPLFWIILGWTGLSFLIASIPLAMKYPYFMQIVPPVITLIAMAIPLYRRWSVPAQAGLALVLLVGVAHFAQTRIRPVTFPYRWNDFQAVVDYVQGRTDSEDCLWTWGALNDLNYLAQRDNCTAAIFDTVLMVSDQYPVVRNRNEYLQELFRRPPALHVSGSVYGLAWGFFPELQAYAERYRGRLLFENRLAEVYEVDVSALHSAQVNFGNEIDLIAYDLSPAESFCPGTEIQLAMTWQRRNTPAQEYQMFAKILTADEQAEMASFDAPPADEPTYTWVDPGQIELGERFALQIPADAPPGQYKVAVGLYEVTSGERVPVVNDQAPAADYAVLQQIDVQACAGTSET